MLVPKRSGSRALEAAFGDVVARHEALRARCEVAGTSVNLVPADEVVAEFHRPASATDLLPVLGRPMDPFSGDLCRAGLVIGSAGEGCTAEFTRVDPPQGITELLAEVMAPAGRRCAGPAGPRDRPGAGRRGR